MYILYLDTSGEFSHISLLKEGTIIDKRKGSVSNDHSKSLLMLIDDMILANGIQLNQIEGIAVMNGPGSYTGLRISLATAKGFCYAHNMRLILLNKLDLMYHSLGTELEACLTLIPARENEYFVSGYNENGINTLNPILMYLDDLLNYLNQNPSRIALESSLPEFERFSYTLVEISDRAVERLICNALEQNLEEDVMLSEPFYLKNVFINKINKL